MELAHRWSDRNLTRMELVVALLILAILIGFFSHYMFKVFGKVEKSMIDRTLININTALHVRASFAYMERDQKFFENLEKINPLELMAGSFDISSFENSENIQLKEINTLIRLPLNYGGAVIDDSDTNLESSLWYFDQDDSFLFYRIKNDEFFSSNIDGPARVRFKVYLDYIDRDNDSSFNLSADHFNSIKLKAIDDFEWSI